MPKLKERGFAHIFLIIFLIAGLAVVVYLVQKKTNIFPKAYENPNTELSRDKVPSAPRGLKYYCHYSQNNVRVTLSWYPSRNIPQSTYYLYTIKDSTTGQWEEWRKSENWETIDDVDIQPDRDYSWTVIECNLPYGVGECSKPAEVASFRCTGYPARTDEECKQLVGNRWLWEKQLKHNGSILLPMSAYTSDDFVYSCMKYNASTKSYWSPGSIRDTGVPGCFLDLGNRDVSVNTQEECEKNNTSPVPTMPD